MKAVLLKKIDQYWNSQSFEECYFFQLMTIFFVYMPLNKPLVFAVFEL